MTTGPAQKTIEWAYRGRDSLARFEDAAERTTTRYQLLPVAVASALYLAITIQLAKTLEHSRCGLAGRRDVLTAASEAANSV